MQCQTGKLARLLSLPSLAAIATLWAATPARAYVDCDSSQRFFLRASVETTPLFGCAGLNAAPKSAGLSFSEDYLTGDWALNVSGGMAYLLTDGRVTPREGVFNGLALVQVPLAFYVQGSGTFSSGGESRGVFRAGIKTDLVFQNFGGEGLEALTVTSALYRQFDFNGASGMGIKATLRPWSLRRNLNAAKEDANRQATAPYFFWSPYAAIDAYWGDDPGNTELTVGQDYFWAEVGSNFTYVVPALGVHGARFELGVSHHVDLKSGVDATLGEARLSMHLNERKTTALAVTYTKGTDYRSLEKIDQLKVEVGLRF